MNSSSIRSSAIIKLAKARVLSAQADKLRAEAEEELLTEGPSETPTVTEMDKARARRIYAKLGGR
jgi:hypothetical protein